MAEPKKRAPAKKAARRRKVCAAPARKKGGDARRRMVSVRFSEGELVEVERAAGAAAGGCAPNVRGYMRDAVLDRARGASSAPLVPDLAEAYRGARCGQLYTPQGAEGACYEIRSAGALITSHNPETWRPDDRYPRAVQERDYFGDQNERAKVLRIAGALRPDLLLALTPTAVDGPPVVSAAGVVLGGNGRTMGVRLAYSSGSAEVYRRELQERAPMFGLRREDVDAVADPVLVRVVRGLDGAAQAELASASSRYNQGLTNSLDERARAVSLSRRLSRETLAAIADQLDKHDTLRAAMAAAGPVFVRRLEADELVTAQNRAELVDSAGGLAEAGKLLVEGAFIGLAAGTPERLAQAAPSTLQKLERIVPFLARVRAAVNGHDLIPTVQEALDLLYRATVGELPVREYATQGNMFDAPPLPEVVELAARFESLTGKKLASAFRKWAAATDYDPNQGGFFFETRPTPENALRALLEDASG